MCRASRVTAPGSDTCSGPSGTDEVRPRRTWPASASDPADIQARQLVSELRSKQ